jgi:hypothetical protein
MPPSCRRVLAVIRIAVLHDFAARLHHVNLSYVVAVPTACAGWPRSLPKARQSLHLTCAIVTASSASVTVSIGELTIGTASMMSRVT